MFPVLLGALLLAGCATTHPPSTHAVVRRPPAHAPGPVARTDGAKPNATAATKAPDPVGGVQPAAETVSETPAPARSVSDKAEPGSAVPMMGFRPMRGQKQPDA